MLTATSDAYLGVSVEIEPSFVASTVNITSSSPTQGSFVDGVFYASTSGVANILNTDLQTHMESFSTLVESAGTITVQAGVTSSAEEKSLTLKASGDITVSASQTLRTNGGDIVLWSDSDTVGGGVIRLLNNSQICTTLETCATQATGGGDIVLGGGAADVVDPSRPGGFAAGYGTTTNGTGSSTTTGIQVGTMEVAGGAKLFSAGGKIGRAHV
jgi:hypothetical protein